VMILPKEISQEMCQLQIILFLSIIMSFAPMYVVYHTRVLFDLIFFNLRATLDKGPRSKDQ